MQPIQHIGTGWRAGLAGWMSFVSFSPDGRMVASDGATSPDDITGNLTFWSFPEGKLLRSLPVRPTALSSDWKYYATFHEVGETESGRKLISLPEGVFAVHAFSPDARYVAESSADEAGHHPHIRIVELPNGKETTAFGQHEALSLAIAPDGQTLASGHWDLVMLRNLFTGKRLATLRGFGRYVGAISFSPDGRWLAAGTDVGTVQVWDVSHRSRTHSFTLEGGQVSLPAFSPDGRLLAVGVYGAGTVWLIDVVAGKILDHEKVSDIGCGSAAFGPDGQFLITPSTGGLIRWPYDRGGTIRVFQVKVR